VKVGEQLDGVGTREVAWMLAALRSRYGTAQVPEPPPSAFDWDGLFDTARRNGVLQLLQASVGALPEGDISDTCRSRFDLEVRDIGLRNLELTGELLRILELLSGHGIRAVPYKGPVLAQVAYGDLGLRSFGDLDVLLDEDRLEDAIAVLEADGYAAGWPWTSGQLRFLLRHGHDFPMFKQDRVALEMQWAIGSRPHVVPRGVSPLLNRAVTVRIAGKEVPTLSPTDLVLVLAIHGSIHLWSRLSWVCDFVEACLNVRGVDFDAALRLADGVRSRRMLLSAVDVADQILGVRVDPHLAELARMDKQVSAITRRILPALTAAGGPDLRRAQTRVRDRIDLADRLSDGVVGALRAIATPNESDWQSLALPDRLLPLYYPVRSLRVLKFALGIGRGETAFDVFDVH
jgi:hypothetical protein